MFSVKVPNILLIAATIILASCGGGGGGSSPAPSAGAIDQNQPAVMGTHPGHYILSTQGLTGDLINTLGLSSEIQGVSVVYNWVDLEVQRDVYDFSAIENDLATLRPLGKQLIVMIRDKSFSNNPFIPVPAYMITPEFSNGYSGTDGKMAKRWVHAVSDRFRALITALGARFDQDPNFEAIKTSETAIGTGHTDYNVTNYIRELNLNIEALADAFPSKVKVMYINWLSGATASIADIAYHAYVYGVGIGGPDVHPDIQIPSYAYYPLYAGLIPLMVDVQWDNYEHVTPAGDTDQLFNFATSSLHVNYICWLPKSPYGNNTIDTINDNPVF